MSRVMIAVAGALMMLTVCASAFGAVGTVTISNFWCKATGYVAAIGENGDPYMAYKEWDAGFEQMGTGSFSNTARITTSVSDGTAVFTIGDGPTLAPNSYAVIDGDPWIPCDGAKHYDYGFDVAWKSNGPSSYLTLCLEPLPMWWYSSDPHIASKKITLQLSPGHSRVVGNLNGAPGLRFCLSNIQHPIVPEPSSVLGLVGGMVWMVCVAVRRRG